MADRDAEESDEPVDEGSDKGDETEKSDVDKSDTDTIDSAAKTDSGEDSDAFWHWVCDTDCEDDGVPPIEPPIEDEFESSLEDEDGDGDLPSPPKKEEDAALPEGEGDGDDPSFAGERADRAPADLRMQVEGGRLLYYNARGKAKAKFVAVCCPDGVLIHGDCKKCRQAEVGRGKDTGRPLGFLLAWLAEAEPSAEHDHRAETVRDYPHAIRVFRRQLFAESDDPVAALMLSKERKQRAGEPAEPLGIRR